MVTTTVFVDSIRPRINDNNKTAVNVNRDNESIIADSCVLPKCHAQH